jgi:hypothetical protein
VNFGTPPTILGGGTGIVSANATSALLVTFSSVTENVCTVSGNIVTAITAGTCTIAANQAGDATYNPAIQVTQDIIISKATATVVLGNLTQTYDGNPKGVTATTTPAGLVVTITYEGSATPPTNAGSYAVTATINDANYQGTASGTLTISQPTLSVSVGGNGKGDINSDPSGITCSEGTSGTCSYLFTPGTVTLHASPSTISLFGAWTGCTPTTSPSCDVLIDGNKSVSATFILAPKAMIGTNEYGTLNDAYLAIYNSADAGATINLLETEFIENLEIKGKDVILLGGNSADYKTRNGQPTVLKGTLTIKSGSLRANGIVVRDLTVPPPP